MMKRIWIIIACLFVLLLPINAQTKTQVLDDIENTLNDFMSDINSLYENGMHPHERIREMAKAFASPEYFIYNNKQQPSFVKWLSKYESSILQGRYIEHELTIKQQTLEKVSPNISKDKRWKFTATLLRKDFDNDNTFTEDITMIVLWNGGEKYVSILAINREEQHFLAPETTGTAEAGKLKAIVGVLKDTILSGWWMLLLCPIGIIGWKLVDKYSTNKLLNKAISLYKNRSTRNNAYILFQNLAAKKKHPVAYYYIALYLKSSTRAYTSELLDKIMDNLYKAASGGNIDAMFELATFRFRKSDESKDWLKKAAINGHPKAMLMYARQLESEDEKFEWTLKAAEKNVEDAMVLVGYQYMQGKGVEVNKKKAIEWWMKAAGLGNSKAMLEIGNSYYLGMGVDCNTITAKSWYKKAQEAEAKRKGEFKDTLFNDTLYVLGRMYENPNNSLYSLDKAIECYALIPKSNAFYRRGQKKIEDIKRKQEAENKMLWS